MRLPFVLLLLSALTAQAEADILPEAFTAPKPPRLLSDYGLFTDATAQLPASGLVPYDLITPLYSDHAAKFRFIYLPPGTTIRYRHSGVLDFPVGSALVKTFAYPRSGHVPAATSAGGWRLLETRLLVRLADGWQARVYIWNEEQTEAHYKVAGRTIAVDWVQVGDSPEPLRYRVPNLNQCAGCHASDQTLVPLGPKARNLDRTMNYAAFGLPWPMQNQLKAWAAAGLLSGLPPGPVPDAVAAWDDPLAPLDQRARAYLDINCGHCHQPVGAANTSGLYLNWEEKRRVHLGIGKRPVASGRGSGGRDFDLVPGKPDESILLHRMQSDEPGSRMPEISVALPHAEGIELIRQWIAEMPR